MTQKRNDSELQLTVISVGRDGRRRYDLQAKRSLVEAALQPGASLAGLAVKHGINANLLHKWVRQYERSESAAIANDDAGQAPSAFVTVVTSDVVPASVPAALASLATSAPQRERSGPSPRSAPARLSARLPNGVSLELECSGHDAALVTAMIAALGAR
jgi:transposase